MYIKPLRSMHGNYGSIRRGRIANVEDHIALDLIKRGLAVPVQQAREVATGPENPLLAPRSGGRTGAEKRSSSSAADRPSKTRQSRKSGGERE